ncbi:related to non-classical export protein Nce102 [Ramularia collo-cygni]|uniref:Related to non-classical export protein Nce102 n=1 Tax=Ramularia collo-cygni TaxID=112498 RepID=A0A2D3VBM8_9PEZI|nr:related to non-classical export protein Nce102 [Ramularia collo-cygni]CZT22217.1 related to non-classical export protein Nce102 [Ramularia collo-cygni]
MKVANVALRALQLLITIIIMSLVGNMIAMGASPAVVNYVMFCAVIALLALLYLLPAAVTDGLNFHAALPTALDGAIVLFWFCAAVALAAELGVHSCSNRDYVTSNKVMRGASQESSACREAQAATAFLWFGWVTFVGTLAMSAMGFKSGGGASGGIRRGPAMAQV